MDAADLVHHNAIFPRRLPGSGLDLNLALLRSVQMLNGGIALRIVQSDNMVIYASVVM